MTSLDGFLKCDIQVLQISKSCSLIASQSYLSVKTRAWQGIFRVFFFIVGFMGESTKPVAVAMDIQSSEDSVRQGTVTYGVPYRKPVITAV